MRIHVVLALLIALLASGCGDKEKTRDVDNDLPRKSTTIVEYPELDGDWNPERIEFVIQFPERDGWTKPQTLAAGATTSHREYYGSSVRLTVCESDCNDASNIVERPEAIRCQVRASQRRGKSSPLRVTPRLVRDRDGDVGCEWSGSGIVKDQCAPSNEFDGPVDRDRLVSPAVLSSVSRFVFVERRGCAMAGGGVRFTKMGWEGSFDCNSAAGRWRMDGAHRVRIGTRSSTTMACGGSPHDIAPEDIAYIERLPSGDIRLLDEHWFPLAVGTPQRTVPDAYSAPEHARIAVIGIVIARDDDARICSGVYASVPPGCGDVGGRSGRIGSTMRVEGLDLGKYETERASGVQWIEEATLAGRRDGDTFTVIESP